MIITSLPTGTPSLDVRAELWSGCARGAGAGSAEHPVSTAASASALIPAAALRGLVQPLITTDPPFGDGVRTGAGEAGRDALLALSRNVRSRT
jgi:hypothetical protein